MASKSASSRTERLVAANRYAAVLLGLPKTDPLSLANVVSTGFSYKVFEKFSKEAKISAVELGHAIRVPERTLVRRKSTGHLQPEESDRLLRTSRVFALAIDLFEGDRDSAKRWLETPQRALGGATPLALAATDVGAREVENLIGRLEHGVVV